MAGRQAFHKPVEKPYRHTIDSDNISAVLVVGTFRDGSRALYVQPHGNFLDATVPRGAFALEQLRLEPGLGFRISDHGDYIEVGFEGFVTVEEAVAHFDRLTKALAAQRLRLGR